MSNLNEEIDYLVKLSQVTEKNLTPDLFSKSEKYRTLLRFSEARRLNPHASQSQLCKSIGTSPSTMERIRKDLNVTSPYRYSVPVKSDLQKEKDKYKRAVHESFKKGTISEDRKLELYEKINSTFDKQVKDEVTSVCPTLMERKKNIVSRVTSHTNVSMSTSDRTQISRKSMKGGKIETDISGGSGDLEKQVEQMYSESSSRDKYLKMLNN